MLFQLPGHGVNLVRTALSRLGEFLGGGQQFGSVRVRVLIHPRLKVSNKNWDEQSHGEPERRIRNADGSSDKPWLSSSCARCRRFSAEIPRRGFRANQELVSHRLGTSVMRASGEVSLSFDSISSPVAYNGHRY